MSAPCELRLVQSVVEFIDGQVFSERVLAKIENALALLSEFPDIGRVCDPEYAVARPPFPCRSIAVPDTPFTLYYQIDDDARSVLVFYIEHQSSDPLGRFTA